MDKLKAKMNEAMVFSIMIPAFTTPIHEIPRPKKSRLEKFVDMLQTTTMKAVIMAIFFAHIGVSSPGK